MHGDTAQDWGTENVFSTASTNLAERPGVSGRPPRSEGAAGLSGPRKGDVERWGYSAAAIAERAAAICWSRPCAVCW